MAEQTIHVNVPPRRRGQYFIRAVVSDYWMDFECVKCVGWSRCNIPLYEKKDELKEPSGGSPPTEDPDHGFISLHGFLKWDGCMEIERENIHTCEASEIEEEYLCLRRIHQIASQAMGHWEGEIPRALRAEES